jgi:hypothetical protein
MLGVFAWPTLQGKLHWESDLGAFYVPVRAFYQEALRSGTQFLWYPYELAGFYLHGEGQAGLFHPLNLHTYRWLPYTLAYGLEMTRGYALAGAGAYLFFRRYALPRSAAMLGAFYFAFSSFHALHYMHPNVVAATAHLPWLLLALDVATRGSSRRSRALAAPAYALLTASQLLLGHPQAIWLCAVVELLYAWLLFREGASLGALTRIGVAKALGILAAAIQLLPTWDALQGSVRLHPTSDFIDLFSLHPWNFTQLVQPYLFQHGAFLSIVEFGLYAGGFGLLALVWIAAGRCASGPQRRLAHGALVLAGLGALLALGAHGWVQSLLTALPVIGGFRAASRYTFWITTAASAAVALAYAGIAARRTTRLERAVALTLPLLATAVGLWLLPARFPSDPRPASIAWLGVASLAVTVALALMATRGAPAARAALVLFACIDLGVYDASFLGQREPRPASLDEIRAGVASAPRAPGFRVAEGPMAATLFGVRYLWGHVALWPVRQLPIASADGERLSDMPTPAWQASLRVASVADPRTRGAPMPRARLISNIRVTASPGDDIAEIDVSRTALVEEFVAVEGPSGRVSIERETPGELLLRAHAPAQQLLVLSESWHQGWRAWVDGAPAQILRVYGDFMGCVVPPGEHEIRLHFEPASFVQGARVSAGALAAIAAWGGVAFARSGRRAAPREIGAEAARGDEQVEPRP